MTNYSLSRGGSILVNDFDIYFMSLNSSCCGPTISLETLGSLPLFL